MGFPVHFKLFFFPLTIISISRVKRDKQKSQVLTIHGDEETHLFLFIVSWRHKQPAAVHFTAIAILSLLFHAENKTRITKLDKWAHGRLNKRCDGGESDKFFPAVTPRVTDTYFKRRVNDLSHTQTETSRQCCCGWRTVWGKGEKKKKKALFSCCTYKSRKAWPSFHTFSFFHLPPLMSCFSIPRFRATDAVIDSKTLSIWTHLLSRGLGKKNWTRLPSSLDEYVENIGSNLVCVEG